MPKHSLFSDGNKRGTWRSSHDTQIDALIDRESAKIAKRLQVYYFNNTYESLSQDCTNSLLLLCRDAVLISAVTGCDVYPLLGYVSKNDDRIKEYSYKSTFDRRRLAQHNQGIAIDIFIDSPNFMPVAIALTELLIDRHFAAVDFIAFHYGITHIAKTGTNTPNYVVVTREDACTTLGKEIFAKGIEPISFPITKESVELVKTFPR